MHSPFVGAYWAAREESREACASRCVKFFDMISGLPGMSRWAKKSSSKLAKINEVSTGLESLLKLLKTNNRDINGAAISELGFSLALWNGDAARPVSISILCGAYSPRIKNCVVLNLPTLVEPMEEDFRYMKSIADALIMVWDPDSVIASSSQSMEQQGGGLWTHESWFRYSR